MTRTTPARSGLARGLRAAAAVALAAALGACAAAPQDPQAFAYDPYQPLNRDFHGFNKGLDTIALRPAAYVYGEVTPALVRHLLGNAFDTLDMPGIAVNHLLQGDVLAAMRAAGRLGVNLIAGLGVLDPATEFGLPREDTDFGLTLASWGVEEGAYVELPVFGPSTERDVAGRVIDSALSPLTWIAPAADLPAAVGYGVRGLEAVDFREANYETLDRILYDSEDSYIAAQTAYLQLRRRAVAGGASEDALPDVFAD